MINAGSLDRRVRLEARVESAQDAAGQPVATWVEIATVYARKKALNGRELFAGAQVVPGVTDEYLIRYRADMTPSEGTKARLVDEDGVAYDITYIGEVERKKWLRLLVQLPGDPR